MSFIISIFAFIFVLTVLVFVHELGHYAVARWCGIRVETFSVGFGPEIKGWTDSKGTRWKISWIPFGGYVKFFGDIGVASGGLENRPFTPEERSVSFHHKSVFRRIAVVSAGPLANFIFAILMMGFLYSTFGQPFSTPIITAVEPNSIAESAGFQANDRFVEINGYKTDRFEDLMQIVMTSPGRELTFVVERSEQNVPIKATPGSRTIIDRSGNEREVGYLGIRGGEYEMARHPPHLALWYATKQTSFITQQTLYAVYGMLKGTVATDDLRGPIGIAQLSGEITRFGIAATFEFMALLSISLGLINLFPIPMLDGGHLLYYVIEVLRGRPLGQKAQEFGFRIGLALVFSLMLFATWNDVIQLQIFERVRGMF